MGYVLRVGFPLQKRDQKIKQHHLSPATWRPKGAVISAIGVRGAKV